MHSSSSAPVQHVSHSTSSPPSHSLSSYPHTGTTAAPAAPTAAEVRAHLLTRLRAAQRHAARLQSVDPVAQAFDFFHTVSGLTG
jgi:hypothetical protein